MDKVLFDKYRARGVRARTTDGWVTFEGGEVVLCAGAIYSPAILMRSGVGPPEHLRDLGITVLQDLPVGSNVNEHAAIDLDLVLKEPAVEVKDKFAVSCLVRFSSELAGAGRNDMGFGSFNIFKPREGTRARGSVFVTLFQSFSRGTVRLLSADPEVDPSIDFNMLSDHRDMVRMREGVRRPFELAAQPGIASIVDGMGIGGVRSESKLPGDLNRWLLERCGSIGHPCGGAPMGARDDPQSVLGPDCCPHGLEGLRVADGSSMPNER